MLNYSYEGNVDFSYLLEELQNPIGTLRQFRLYVYGKRQKGMASGVDPYGNPYKPLKPGYARSKRRKYGDRPILTASGKTNKAYRSFVRGKSLIEEYNSKIAGFNQESGRLRLPDDRGLPQDESEELLRLATAAIGRAWRRG